MLDFPDHTYHKLLRLATEYNIVSDCREYPSLVFNFLFHRQKIPFPDLQAKLKKKFMNPLFRYGLYINFPFCRARCSFCKYYSELMPNSYVDDYIESIKQELELYNINFSIVNLDNVYFGGGTPSILNPKQIRRLSSILNQFFSVNHKKDKIQITMEGTPESIEESRLKEFYNSGFNRISLGVQSFNDNVLRAVGRLHTTKDVFTAFKIIRKVGITYTGIDLMFGLPGETSKSYQNTIRQTLELNPDFIECFMFTLGGRTKISPAQDLNLDKIIQLFKERFVDHGYQIYFSGNFLGFIKNGIPPANAMNQNTEGVYKFITPCFGIGAGAHSHFFDLKYSIFPDVKDYINTFKNGGKEPSFFYGFDMSEDDSKRQYIISQIGYYRFIEKDNYYRIFGSRIDDDFSKEIECLKKLKIVSNAGNRISWHLDEKGMGHNSFFLHAIRYWYHPKHISQLLPVLNFAP